jgi:hypothetical protein
LYHGADEGGEDRPVTEEEFMYEEWKSQPYALTLPLRIVGLRGSVPPIWLKVGCPSVMHAIASSVLVEALMLCFCLLPLFLLNSIQMPPCAARIFDVAGNKCKVGCGV